MQAERQPQSVGRESENSSIDAFQPQALTKLSSPSKEPNRDEIVSWGKFEGGQMLLDFEKENIGDTSQELA